MDRVAAMLILLGMLVGTTLVILALFSYAPIFCSCVVSLLYTLYLFISNEGSGIHHAQEFENRFWTIFAILFATALFFANDSPIAFGLWSPNCGFLCVIFSGYAMHLYDRHLHRLELSREHGLRRGASGAASLNRLVELGIPVEKHLEQINSSLSDIDQQLIPSTINNFINLRFVLKKEREIISTFAEVDAKILNYIIQHVKLGLLFYKVKDHRNFSGNHRTELVETLAVIRISALSVLSRVLVLHAIQMMRLSAHPRAEHWVKNILLSTTQDDLSELKTLTDAKGDYFCMNKLIYDDIRSESIRQDIIRHFKREAAVQEAHMNMKTKKSKIRKLKAWRKILSDVDDTLYCSGGSYPAGIDKRYGKKVVYPGVLSFYRELDLGLNGPEKWPTNAVGNLVFLSARPHVYKDMSEKHNFAKFEKLRCRGMHTNPSLLAGDIASGTTYMLQNDMEPLALKKYENFKRYVSIYPEFKHIFIGDNGQGDVRAGDLMHQSFPNHLDVLYVHLVKPLIETHGYAPLRWKETGLKICCFQTYPDAALDAAQRTPPLIRISGLRSICLDSIRDFHMIQSNQWPSLAHLRERREELNHGICRCNQYLRANDVEEVPLIESERIWNDGTQVRTPYGIATIESYEPIFDLYSVKIDWRPLDMQVAEYKQNQQSANAKSLSIRQVTSTNAKTASTLETVMETSEADDDSVACNTENKNELEQSATSIKMKYIDSFGHNPSHSAHSNKPKEISYIRATIQGRLVTKYDPPQLPKLAKGKSHPIFSFLGAGGERSKSKSKKKEFKQGDNCTTPYGIGTIEEYIEERGVVIVSMTGWKAQSYLRHECVQVVSETGILGNLLKKMSASESGGEKAKQQKDLKFPNAIGTAIRTPFGDGIVSRPILMPLDQESSSKMTLAATTLAISLNNWTLADGSHPILYCTPDRAREWKDSESIEDKSNLFSALRFKVREKIRTLTTAPPPPKSEVIFFDRYFLDGANVATPFGNGRVRTFREKDGFYEIDLMDWKLNSSGSFAKAYLQRDALSHRMAHGCQEGFPVLTSYGMSGNLASVEPTTGVHIVTIPSAGIVCYLQPDDIVSSLKAAVGEEVFTPYGEGTVERFRLSDGTYRIKLKGWGAILYANAETLDRVNGGEGDRDGPFGMKWLLRFLFFSSDSNKSTSRSQMSRSNSF